MALRLRRNWLVKHGSSESGGVDLNGSLTELDWLVNLNLKQLKTMSTSASSPETMNTCNQRDIVSETRQVSPSEPDLKTSSRKPPHSYAKLITMAIRESEAKQLILSDIYKWIRDNYPYYRTADSNWHNSVRHNLSLSKSFQKVPRRSGYPGKVCFWALSPEHKDWHLRDGCNQKRSSQEDTSYTTRLPIKRIKKEKENDILTAAINMSDIFYTDEDSNDELSAKYSTPRKLPLGNSENKTKFHVEQKKDVPRCPAIQGESLLKTSRSQPKETMNILPAIDANWSDILHQDIKISGINIKTEDIIDDNMSNVNSRPGSPYQEDLYQEDLLLSELDPNLIDRPLDLTNYLPLDLSTLDDKYQTFDYHEEVSCSLDNTSRMSTPTNLSDMDNYRSLLETLTQDESITTLFDREFSSIFDIMEVFPNAC